MKKGREGDVYPTPNATVIFCHRMKEEEKKREKNTPSSHPSAPFLRLYRNARSHDVTDFGRTQA